MLTVFRHIDTTNWEHKQSKQSYQDSCGSNWSSQEWRDDREKSLLSALKEADRYCRFSSQNIKQSDYE